MQHGTSQFRRDTPTSSYFLQNATTKSCSPLLHNANLRCYTSSTKKNNRDQSFIPLHCSHTSSFLPHTANILHSVDKALRHRTFSRCPTQMSHAFTSSTKPHNTAHSPAPNSCQRPHNCLPAVVLTCYATVALEHTLYIGLGALEGIEVAHEGPGVDGLRILRIGLVAHFTHLAFTSHSSTQRE